MFFATAAGRRALKEGLEHPTLDEMRRDPQGVAGRLRFLDGAAARTFLEEYARLSLQCAEELKGHAGLAEQHDAALYAARAKWAAGAIRKFA